MSNIISLNELRRRTATKSARGSSDPLVKLSAELDFRSARIIDEIDSVKQEIDTLRKQNLYLIKIVKQLLGD